MKPFLFGLVVAMLSTHSATAKSSLWDYKRIDNGLFAVGMAMKVAENCTTLHQNRVAGLWFLLRLQSYAIKQGYTREEVRAFVKNPDEQAKLEARIDKKLRELGYDPSEKDALCAFGRLQRKGGSQTGRLLTD